MLLAMFIISCWQALIIFYQYVVHRTQRDLEDVHKSALDTIRRELASKERLLDLKTRIMEDKIAALRKSHDSLQHLVMKSLETGQVDKDDEEIQEFVEKLKTLAEYIDKVDSDELKEIIERVYYSKPNKRT